MQFILINSNEEQGVETGNDHEDPPEYRFPDELLLLLLATIETTKLQRTDRGRILLFFTVLQENSKSTSEQYYFRRILIQENSSYTLEE